MKELESLGSQKRKNDKNAHQYSIFECPVCKKQIERRRSQGIKQKSCSVKCAMKVRDTSAFRFGNSLVHAK